MAKMALLIGVSEYQSGLPSLSAAERDVEAVRQVLQDSSIGDFASADITTLLNPDPQQMREALVTLFRERQKSDMLLIYFSGHGMTDDRGTFYLTCARTQSELLEATAIPANFVHELMENSRSKQQIVVLDCCFSGAFAKNMAVKGAAVNLAAQLGGQGRAVLASSSATEYSFEQKEANLSVYTRYWVEGLQTGAADEDGNGWISVDELHSYTCRKVRESAPAMKPQIYAAEEGYKIVLAKAPVGDPLLEYRKEVERLAQMREGQFSPILLDGLDETRKKLALSVETAQVIQDEVLRPYQELQNKLQQYEQAVNSALQPEGGLSQTMRDDLYYLQQALGLRDVDVAAINSKIPASLMLRMKGVLNVWNHVPNQPASQQRQVPRPRRRLPLVRETVRPENSAVATRKNPKLPVLLGSVIAVAIGGGVTLPSVWNSKVEPFPTLRTVIPWFGGERATYPYLGVRLATLTPELAKQNNDDPNSTVVLPQVNGAWVTGVTLNSSADIAGIQQGDVIVQVEGQATNTADQVVDIVQNSRIGRSLRVTVRRGDRTQQFIIDPAEIPAGEYHYNRGIARAASDKPQEAIEDFTEAIRLQPDYAAAFYSRGNAKRALDDSQGAIADYTEAIQINKNWGNVNPEYYGLSTAFYSRGIAKRALEVEDSQGAIEDFTEAIRLQPDYAAAYNNRGNAKRALDDQQGAIEDYTEAIRLKPDFAAAFYNRGLAKADLNDPPGAIEDYTEAVRLRSDFADAFYSRGNAKRALDDQQGAIEDYTEAIRLQPNFAAAYNNRGVVKRALDDQQGAIKDYDQAIQINQNWVDLGLWAAFYNRGIIKADLNDQQGAIEDYTEVIRLQPDFALAFYNRGNAKAASDDPQGAIVDYREAARLYRQQGNTEDYRDALNQIEQLEQ